MQTSSPPVITPNRSQSNPDDMITLPRPIQSVGMDLHDVSGTSTGQTLPRERRAPPGTHFCPTIRWVYPPSATIFILHPLLSTFSSTFVRNIPTFDHSSTLKRRPQTSVTAADLVWVCAPPRTIRNWLRRLAFGSYGPGRKILAAAAADLVGLRPAADHPQMVTTPGVLDPADPGARPLQLLLQTWCGSARRGPSANGYDVWRFGSCGPGRKILAAAAADLVWVCAPPRTIRIWLRRLAFWILRTRAQDPCSCCLIFRTKVDEKVDHSGWRIKIVADGGYTHQIVGQKWVPGGALLSRGRVWPVDVPETSCKSMPTL